MSAFGKDIQQFASRDKENFAFSGYHYEELSAFLLETDTPITRAAIAYTPPPPPPSFAPLNLLLNKSHNSSTGAKVVAAAVNVEQDLVSTLKAHMPEEDESLLISLSGWQSPLWLNTLGGLCGLEAELFRRHLSFIKKRDLFDQPSLPSTQLNVWRVRTVIIYKYRESLSLEQVRKFRKGSNDGVGSYLSELDPKDTKRVGSSILRQYIVLDRCHAAIIQEVSLSVSARKSQGWTGRRLNT